MRIDALRSPLQLPTLMNPRCELDPSEERVTYLPTITTCQYPGCTYPAGLKKDRAFTEVNGKPYCDYHYAKVKFGEIVKPCQCGGDNV